MGEWDWIGLLAGALTTIAFIPQVIKVVKERHTRDLSLPTFVIFSLGVAAWFSYGALLGNVAMILANGVTLIMSLIILGFKIRFG